MRQRSVIRKGGKGKLTEKTVYPVKRVVSIFVNPSSPSSSQGIVLIMIIITIIIIIIFDSFGGSVYYLSTDAHQRYTYIHTYTEDASRFETLVVGTLGDAWRGGGGSLPTTIDRSLFCPKLCVVFVWCVRQPNIPTNTKLLSTSRKSYF